MSKGIRSIHLWILLIGTSYSFVSFGWPLGGDPGRADFRITSHLC
jgi:hypothetical protein